MEEIALLSYLGAATNREGRLEETHNTSETRSQGRREVTLASRSLADAELGVIAGVIQGESVTRMRLDWARLIQMIQTSEVKKGKRYMELEEEGFPLGL